MAGGRRRRGGILGLLDLIDEHRGALEYDWLTRFQRDLDESVPDYIGWDKAIRLVRIIRSDPGSMLAAAVEGWERPFSRLEAMVADLWDLTFAATGTKKPQKYPRPWPEKGQVRRRGNAAGRTPEQVRAILAEQFGRTEAPI